MIHGFLKELNSKLEVLCTMRVLEIERGAPMKFYVEKLSADFSRALIMTFTISDSNRSQVISFLLFPEITFQAARE